MKFNLVSKFSPAGDQPRALELLSDSLTSGNKLQTLLGVTGSGKTYVMANIVAGFNRPALVMAPNKTLAAQLYSEFKEFFPNNAVEYFVSYYDYYQPEAYIPTRDMFIEKDASINEQIERMRLSATRALLERSDTIIVSSVSCIYGLGDPSSYSDMKINLKVGDFLGQRDFLRNLARLQYMRNDTELSPGKYRVRGEFIDIHPIENEDMAVRISLFDDVIETIATFDPISGAVGVKMQDYTIYPRSHYVTPRQKVLDTIEKVKHELADRLTYLKENNKLVEMQRLEQRTAYDLEMMIELGYCQGVENYSRYLSGRSAGEAPPTLLDYLPDDALIFLDESHITLPQIGGMYKGDRSRKETLVQFGFRLPSAIDNRPLKFEEFINKKQQMVFVSATPGPYELEHSESVTKLLIRPTGLLDPQVEVRPATTQIDDMIIEVKEEVSKGHRVILMTLTKRMSEKLTEFMYEKGFKVRYLHSDIDTIERVALLKDFREGKFDVLIGINLLREGIDIPELSLIAILDADKEGFLRSRRSLIQIIGRAARNVNGRAILYADKITDSMKFAIAETNERRAIQMAYNEKHNIIPRTVKTEIRDILPAAESEEDESQGDVIVPQSAKEISKEILKLEKEMYKYANDLEFELAAKTRDRIGRLRDNLIKMQS